MQSQSKKVAFLFVAMLMTASVLFGQQYGYTGVFLNGVQLNQQDVNTLAMLQGSPIYQGYYYLDQQGNFGLFGYGPSMNLYEAVARYQAQNQPSSVNQSGSDRYYHEKLSPMRSQGRDEEGSYYRNDMTNTTITDDYIYIDGTIIDF